MPAEWNSLEITKLVVPIVSSLILATVGMKISMDLATFKSAIDRNDKMIDSVVQKRIKLYDDIGAKLNGMFAYYMYLGKWKEMSPEDVVKSKRQLDEIVYTYQPFFSQEFFGAYQALEKAMFDSYTGWGNDAKLRTRSLYRNTYYRPADKTSAWNTQWSSAFTDEDNSEAIRSAYSMLITRLPLELGIPQFTDSQAIRPIPVEQVATQHAPKEATGQR